MKKIHSALVLHEGWEMDNELWVLENDDGSRELRTTNHGGERKTNIQYIDEKIQEAERSIDELKEAKALVG
jgi:hypothetical protein